MTLTVVRQVGQVEMDVELTTITLRAIVNLCESSNLFLLQSLQRSKG